MDESRDTTPAKPARAPSAAGVGKLSPVQQTYSAYTRHAIACDDCRDIDRRCDTGEALWRTYREVSAAAYRQIADAAR